MSGGTVSYDTGAMRRQARALDGQRGELERLAGSASGSVPLGGLPPEAAARVEGVLSAVAADLRQGARTLGYAATELRTRAVFADRAAQPFDWNPGFERVRFLDPEQFTIRKQLERQARDMEADPETSPIDWEAFLQHASQLDIARGALVENRAVRRADLRHLARSRSPVKQAALRGRAGWGQRYLDEHRELRRWLRRGGAIAAFPDRFSVHLPRGGVTIDPKRLTRSHYPSWVKAVGKDLPKRTITKVPLLGPAIDVGVGVVGEDRSVPDAVARSGAKAAGAAGGAAAGATACGSAAAATLGLGAVTCPVLIGGGSFVGGELGGLAYDGTKKLIGLFK
jgi:hypothetical protein